MLFANSLLLYPECIYYLRPKKKVLLLAIVTDYHNVSPARHVEAEGLRAGNPSFAEGAHHPYLRPVQPMAGRGGTALARVT